MRNVHAGSVSAGFLSLLAGAILMAMGASAQVPDIEANEEATRARLCAIVEAQYAYYAEHGCFTAAFEDLTEADPPYLTTVDSARAYDGYTFVLGGSVHGFTANGNALEYGIHGLTGFFVDSTGTIRSHFGGDATPQDAPDQAQCATGAALADFEARARDYVCAIVRAEELYAQAYGSYTTDLDALTEATPPFLLADFRSPIFGYNFHLTGTIENFHVRAEPVEFHEHIKTAYFADSSGVLRSAIGEAANADDPPIASACPIYPPTLNRVWENMLENEARAQLRLCEILAAEEAYRLDTGTYAAELDALLNADPPYLLPVAYPNECAAYSYYASTATTDEIMLHADPAVFGKTGTAGYFVDQTGVLRVETGTSATADSPETGYMCGGEGEGEGEGETPAHSADTNGDGAIDLSELLRLVQLHNSPSYHCALTSEDGYGPGGGVRTCSPHSSDYSPQDWRINLSELLRVVQFYNAGGYLPCPAMDTEDGYCASTGG